MAPSPPLAEYHTREAAHGLLMAVRRVLLDEGWLDVLAMVH
jgi:hypothetical protein